MSDEGRGNGGKWGPWWSGPARSVLPAVIIVGAGGYAIYRNKPLSGKQVVPPPVKDTGGDGGGGGEAPVTGDALQLENVIKLGTTENILAIVLVGALLALALSRGHRGGTPAVA